MKGRARLVTIATAAVVLAFGAMAQDASPPAKTPDPGTTREADNTKRNVNDRSGQTLTPMDQGNDPADLSITAQIRKEIVATKNLSVNAQNVKIITNAGKVTLRGPVNSAEEKRILGAIADKLARPENVDNQLEVKIVTSSNG